MHEIDKTVNGNVILFNHIISKINPNQILMLRTLQLMKRIKWKESMTEHGMKGLLMTENEIFYSNK